MKVLAGVVLYNPTRDRLKQNIDSISGQVDEVLLIDNASSNKAEFEEVSLGCSLIYNEKNMGIAHALNQIFAYAIENEYDWVLTLDQDSVCSKKLIQHYKKYVNLPRVGILSCMVKDRNGGIEMIYKVQKKKYKPVKLCITSASFCSVAAYKKVGGFDDDLFIDYVDFDYCFNLRKNHYKVYRIKHVGLLQEIGDNAQAVNFLGNELIVYKHSPFRYYYIARNDYYLCKKYHSFDNYYSYVRVLYRELMTLVMILLYEENRRPKVKNFLKGTLHGLKHLLVD